MYQEVLEDIDPSYDECPSYCPKYESRHTDVNEFCNICEIKIAKDAYEEETKKLLHERLGKVWEKYGFENLERQVRQTFELKEKRDNLSIVSMIMVNVLLTEENRQRRIKDFNRRQAAKNKEE